MKESGITKPNTFTGSSIRWDLIFVFVFIVALTITACVTASVINGLIFFSIYGGIFIAIVTVKYFNDKKPKRVYFPPYNTSPQTTPEYRSSLAYKRMLEEEKQNDKMNISTSTQGHVDQTSKPTVNEPTAFDVLTAASQQLQDANYDPNTIFLIVAGKQIRIDKDGDNIDGIWALIGIIEKQDQRIKALESNGHHKSSNKNEPLY